MAKKLGDYVKVTGGDDWALLWPVADWELLSEKQRQAVKGKQEQLMKAHSKGNGNEQA